MNRRLAAWAAATFLLACGARTEPGELDLGAGPTGDAGLPMGDAAPLADASPADVVLRDAPSEAGPGCPDSGPLERVYALGDDGTLYRYDPLTGKTTSLGALDCPDTSVIWTMTATTAHAYVVYTDSTLWAVDLATLHCSPTPFQQGQLGLDYDFGVAAFGSGASERIYYYGVPSNGSNAIVAVSDTVSYVLTKVGDVAPTAQGPSFPVNLTADESGHLYAFSPLGLVQELDSTGAQVLRSVDTGVTSDGTWATITYGSSLYLWVQDEVVGHDLATQTRTSDRKVGVDAIGAGSFPLCGG